MMDKKISIFGICVYKRKTKENITTTYVLSIPVLKKIKTESCKKYYLFGIFKKNIYNKQILNIKNEVILNIDKSPLNVLFFLTGGIGDYIIAGAYIKKFCTFFNVQVDIICTMNATTVANLFYNQLFINKIIQPQQTKLEEINQMAQQYDLCIKLSRFPELLKFNEEIIKKYSNSLYNYIYFILDFYKQNEKFFIGHPYLDGLSAVYCLANHVKRYQQPDIGNFLKIDENSINYLNVNRDDNQILQELGLRKKSYITLHRGIDAQKENFSTKLWPTTNYNKLIELLRGLFPSKTIIQLGVSEDKCEKFENTDINLIGKTSFGQLKVLLKSAYLHIDSEGGMVHLRHALGGGKSVVLFGPTSKEFYEYSENINIKGNGCPIWCEWVKNDWNTKCMQSNDFIACMISIKPEIVFNIIKRSCNNVKK